MNRKFESVIDSSFEDTHSVVAKLRRLKIQESLLLKNINKLIPKEHESEVDLPILYCIEFKQFSKQVKESFTEINIKFEDIKAESEEKLSCLDIETMKRDVMKLDSKIRTFKNFILTELTTTISKEEELMKTVDNVDEKQSSCLNKPKPRSKLLNRIVPSPVKVLIKSPFKCKEVQDLQEFMMNSANRCGGWNEYNHNTFIHIWQKHFNTDITKDVFELDDIIGNPSNFEAFQKEALTKIPGSTKEDIISHQKWYSKYLYLKEKQQSALNKWRKNQKILTRTNNDNNNLQDQKRQLNSTKSFNTTTNQIVRNVEDFLNTVEFNDATEMASALCDMSFEKEDLSFHSEIDIKSMATSNCSGITNEEKRSIGGVLKPTKQWINRCNSSQDIVKNYSDIEKNYSDIEKIRKLRIPDWRLALRD